MQLLEAAPVRRSRRGVRIFACGEYRAGRSRYQRGLFCAMANGWRGRPPKDLLIRAGGLLQNFVHYSEERWNLERFC